MQKPDDCHPYESTTHWVQEVARRRTPAGGPTPSSFGALEIRRSRSGGRPLGIRREIYLLAGSAAAFANYYFLSVMVEITSLPTLMVFVAQPPIG
jgi:hypothetical protein